jgi:hypothetical protein
MPSRRTLLTGTAAAAATALAGCSGGDALEPATQDDTPSPPDDAVVVATGEAVRDAPSPNGWFRLSAAVYERDRGDATALDLFTEHRLIPGENEHAGNGWRLGELAVEHGYDDALAVGTNSSFRPTQAGESAPVRLGHATADSTRRWTLRFPDTGDSTWGATFVTELDPETTPGEGDALATVRARVRETKQWSLDEHEATLSADLVYGRDRRP